MKTIQIKQLQGSEILPYLSLLGHLRIQIFRDYPYLYDGNRTYEETYLQTYADCPESIMVIVEDGERLVGASTAIPLVYETDAIQQPFTQKGIDVRQVFYFGESVLLKPYRGQNVYRHFFQLREQAAREYGSCFATFCAVERPQDHPRKPRNYQSLEPVWQHFGYQKQRHLTAYFDWKDIDEAKESAKPLVFWQKQFPMRSA